MNDNLEEEQSAMFKDVQIDKGWRTVWMAVFFLVPTFGVTFAIWFYQSQVINPDPDCNATGMGIVGAIIGAIAGAILSVFVGWAAYSFCVLVHETVVGVSGLRKNKKPNPAQNDSEILSLAQQALAYLEDVQDDLAKDAIKKLIAQLS